MTINKKRFNIYTICMIALLTAMMVLLKRTIAIETPYIKINFASLPIMLGAMLFGPVEGMVVGLLGELIAQITGPYGLAPTTVLYVAPRRRPRRCGGYGRSVVPPNRQADGEQAGGMLCCGRCRGGPHHCS